MRTMLLQCSASLILFLALGCAGEANSGEPARSAPPPEPCTASVVPAPEPIASVGATSAEILKPGDTVCLVAAPDGAWHAARQVAARSPHVRVHVSFEQGMTMLQVRNDTAARLVYRAAMMTAGGWRQTDVLPVMAGLDNFESWPTPLDALAVFDLREQ